MKKGVLTIAMLCMASLFGFAVGLNSNETLYLTAEDYETGQITEVHDLKLPVHQKGKIGLRADITKDSSVFLEKSHVWGYTDEYGYTYRMVEQNFPKRVIYSGSIYLYTNFHVRASIEKLENTKTHAHDYYVSKGASDEITHLTRKNILEFIKDNEAVYNNWKDKKIKMGDLIKIVHEYNDAQGQAYTPEVTVK